MKIFILSGITNGEESVVLGVYSSSQQMQQAVNFWNDNKTKLRHYFYDVMTIDDEPVWTNKQSAIYPHK